MPLLMSSNSLPHLPTGAATYPAVTKQAAGLVDGINTEITTMSFSDKIMITITQNGGLAQWVR